MANYASVVVKVTGKRETVTELYRFMCNAKADEVGMSMDEYPSFHLKFLLDRANIPEVDGLVLDGRSYFTFFDLTDGGTLTCDLEQPWNANLSRFRNWVKSCDPDAQVLYFANEPMTDYYASNDEEFVANHPHFGYEDIE